MTQVTPNPWPELAANFAARFPRAALHAAVVEVAGTRPVDESWCVAFSGGSDSLALLLLVWAHWPERRDQLTALHFNHCLRGEASDGDELFCREVCAALGISFSSSQWHDGPAQPNEAETREARLAFFGHEMIARHASVLWTGHQKDDIAETLLMRLSRGSGPAGLAAPRPVSVREDGRVFLRPLLTFGKSEIAAALTEIGASWREDLSNATREHFRNRIRYEVLPRWQDAAFRSVLGGAALSRELCEEDDIALEAWLAELKIVATETMIDLRPLSGKPRALWRRALRRWAPIGALSRTGFEELLALCESGGAGRVSLSAGFAVLKDGAIHWEKSAQPLAPRAPATLHFGVALRLHDGAELLAQPVKFSPELRQRVLSGKVDCTYEAFLDHAGLPLTVRLWLPGDRFHSLGAPGSAKLQDLFVNRKIPIERRGKLPLVCTADGEILWIPGFSPAERVKITDQTASGVQLTYHSGTSTLNNQSLIS